LTVSASLSSSGSSIFIGAAFFGRASDANLGLLATVLLLQLGRTKCLNLSKLGRLNALNSRSFLSFSSISVAFCYFFCLSKLDLCTEVSENGAGSVKLVGFAFIFGSANIGMRLALNDFSCFIS